MTIDASRRYWFVAKRHGWGWGLPAAWQGWVVLVAFIGSIIAAAVMVAPISIPLYLIGALVLTVAFIVICWIKGEPPRWR